MRDVTVKLLDWAGQNDFTLQDSLAKGTYGQIYLATHNRSGNEFVVKVRFRPLSVGWCEVWSAPRMSHRDAASNEETDLVSDYYGSEAV